MQYNIFARRPVACACRSSAWKRPNLERLFWSHINELQRRVGELNYMSGLQCLGVYVVNVMRMEDAWTSAVENCLFTWRICETEAAPAVVWLVLQEN